MDKIQNGIGEIGASPFLTRSLTFNTPAASDCSSPALQRNSSFKDLYSSPFDSMVAAGSNLKGKVWKLCSFFEAAKTTSRSPESIASPSPSSAASKSKGTPPLPDSLFRLPGTEDRVVIYFTSLRGIRRTFQDCSSVRMILRGFGVNLDERDISMDDGYRKELQRVLGENNCVSVPQVFIKGKYIGGDDVIRQLLESGELARLIKGLPSRPAKPCEACGDVRFIPCNNCDGSRKVYDEDEEQAKRCGDCNENGLVRCPICCL